MKSSPSLPHARPCVHLGKSGSQAGVRSKGLQRGRCFCQASTYTSNGGKTRTQRMLEAIDAQSSASSSPQAGGAGGSNTFAAFQRADDAWNRLRNMPEGRAAGQAPQFVRVRSSDPLPSFAAAATTAPPSPSGEPGGVWDVVVCGGTLGVFIAAALAVQGLRVAVLERAPLRGRAQEWNISRKEVEELVQLGLLTEDELEAAIGIEFNPVRVGFKGAGEVWTTDVLNLGVRPDVLIQAARARVEAAGGAVFDKTPLEGMTVHGDGVALALCGGATLAARLVVDCMGHASPVVQQLRWGRKPDGVCIVVGTMGSGFTSNTTADVIYTHTDLQPPDADVSRLQLFWEAFPSGSGPTDRTTYMFTYMDAAPWRPSMATLFDAYWPLMADYQGVRLEDITFKRALFGLFPTFRDSPLPPGFDRIIQAGDASGIQSPLSFGGFGALTRHLRRLTGALADAVRSDALDASSLRLIHAYNPGLSSSWMLQRAMSVRQGGGPPPDLINKMLGANFQAMAGLGDPVMRPFLQDVIQLRPLLATMAQQMATDPGSVPQLIAHVGPGPLLDWVRHVGGLAAATALHETVGPVLRRAADSDSFQPKQRFALRRLAEAWEFGAGLDYHL